METIPFLKCLSDPTRLMSTLLIRSEGELCVCELTEALEMSQPKISRHLAQLRECQLLQDRRQGQWIFYSLSDALPSWGHHIIDAALIAQARELNEALTRLQRMGDRPARTERCCE